MSKSTRDTIFLEEAEVIGQQAYPGAQFVLRVRSVQLAAKAKPGQFAHIRCDPALPLRRPLSIMRVDTQQAWVEFLYKVLGGGTQLLSERSAGDTLSVLGPIGKPFQGNASRTMPLLIGGGVGIPPMVFLADRLRNRGGTYEPWVIMGSEVPFPFEVVSSQIAVTGVPTDINGAMALLEEWGVASRLVSLQGFTHCFKGYVTDLARVWLDTLSGEQRRRVEVFSCGPYPMLEAVAKMAKDYQLPCQVSVEEFMACGVGGCAGCVIEVQTPQGPAMKRVCVDGPVFAAQEIFGGS